MSQRADSKYDPALVWIPLALLVFVGGVYLYAVVPLLNRPDSPLVGKPAPEFALPVMHAGAGATLHDGERVKLASLRGRVVVLDFWASWCGPCKQQIPALEQAAKLHPKVAFVGVNTSDAPDAAVAFARAQALSYPSLHDEGGRTSAAYRVNALPQLVVIDAQGKVTAVKEGAVPGADLERLLLDAEQ